jgi:hypothetical protein
MVARLHVGASTTRSTTGSSAWCLRPRNATQAYPGLYRGFLESSYGRCMLRIGTLIRTLLLGPDESCAMRFACTQPAIAALAAVALMLHLLDLSTGIRLMSVYGLEYEQNPLARTLFQATGSLGLGAVKMGVVLGGIWALVYLAQNRRGRLARNGLLAVAILGLLGFSSNLV